jgi:E3 ubiquitin-protein ligase DOA10
MKYNPSDKKPQFTENIDDKPQCKICLEETEEPDNFLFNPCICSGSCGTVHLECLTQWIHFKVKK